MASTSQKYQQALFAKRKTSDIQRLAMQYQKQATGLTGEYETAYSNYQKNVAEQMAPYEEQMKKYKEVDTPAYESATAAYKKKLDEYNAKLEDIQNNPTEPKAAFKIINYYGQGTWSLQPTGVNDVVFFNDARLLKDIEEGTYSKSGGKNLARGDIIYAQESRPVPGKFTGKAPLAPTAPTAPTIGEFDETPFQQKKEELETTYKRELSERKSARLGAARRESSRPLLQGK